MANSVSNRGIVDELGYVPLSQTGSELLFDVFSRRYENGATIVTSNLPFQEWTSVFASGRFTGALLDRITHHVHILEMNGEELPAQAEPIAAPATVRLTPLALVGPQAPPTRGPPPAARRARRLARGALPWTTRTSCRRDPGALLLRRAGAKSLRR